MLSDLKKLFFYRQHPDAALRYLPIVDLIKKNNWGKAHILEIGSGSYGIAPYLKKPVVGVDQDFTEPEFSLLKQVKGSALSLPFGDNSFDIVILSDVLEHLPPHQRSKAISEAVRVGGKAVIVSGPFGKEAARQDKQLADYSLERTHKLHPFFADHLKYGLPEIEEVSEIAERNHKVKKVKLIDQFLNLDVREKLMKYFISDNRLVYYFYLKGLMLLVPLLSKMNKPPCYRQLILLHLR